MNVLLVAYDPSISKPAEERLKAIIKAQPKWAKVVPNVFVTVTPLEVPELRTKLGTESSTKLIVFDVTNQLWGTYKASPKVADWLNNNWRQ